MIRADIYHMEPQIRNNYQKAKKRKDQLRLEGWRVKIRKNSEGLFQIWKKHVEIMDLQRGHGKGRD